MKLSVATNFEPALVDGLAGLPVTELYGKLREDVVGGGRAPYQLAAITRQRLADHVAHAKRKGIEFNYLLNASCLGNREITRHGQSDIEKLLGWVSEIGVAAVTVATPLMLRLVKTRFPKLKVRISLFAGVDRVRKAQMWDELGADTIVLDSILVNRELETLRQIRKHVKCELELLVNNNCLQSCALSPMHMNSIAHATQSWHANGGFLIDWCFLKCTQMKMQDPVNYVRSEWIRPEDLHVFEEMGYEKFKIVERDIPTPVMLKRVQAYASRSYDGNLLDLIQPYAFKDAPRDQRYYKKGLAWLLWVFKYAFRPFLVNPARMMAVKRLAELRGMVRPIEGAPPVFVDNKALDGFIERFKTKGCCDTDCDSCRWCHRFAEKAVRVDPEHRAKALDAYDEVFHALDSGEMWRYAGTSARRVGSAGCGGCAAGH